MPTRTFEEWELPTPQQILNAITAWRTEHEPSDRKFTLQSRIERLFEESFGSSYGLVPVDQLPQAIDALCDLIAAMDIPANPSPEQRLSLLIEHLVRTVGTGSSRAGLSDVLAMMSALQRVRMHQQPSQNQSQ